LFNCKSKKSRFWFSCSFFCAASRELTRTIVHTQQERLELQVKVSEQLFQQTSLAARQNSDPSRLQGFFFRTIVHIVLFIRIDSSGNVGIGTTRPCPLLDPGITCCRSEQLYDPRCWRSPIPIRFRGVNLPEAEQFSRLRPDPAPITPIPLRVRTILRSPCLHPV